MRTEVVTELDSAAVEQLLKELIALEKDVKPKLKRIDDIKTMCRNTGSFSTENYVCVVKESVRQAMVSLAKATELIGMEFIQKNNLVTYSKVLTVSVSEKSDL